MIGTNMTGMAKAIQEAKVSPVPSPNLWMRVSGTTRFGGDPVQEQSRKSLGWCIRTCDHPCAANIGCIGNAEKKEISLSFFLASLLDVHRQLRGVRY